MEGVHAVWVKKIGPLAFILSTTDSRWSSMPGITNCSTLIRLMTSPDHRRVLLCRPNGYIFRMDDSRVAR